MNSREERGGQAEYPISNKEYPMTKPRFSDPGVGGLNWISRIRPIKLF
jgi:hypothetical protein